MTSITEQHEESGAGSSSKAGPFTWMLRGVILLNFLRLALSFVPWFEGTDKAPGFSDKIFNPNHTDGFRTDFIWLFFSTVAILFASLVFLSTFKEDRSSRINFFLCVAWVVAFVLYLVKIVVTGELYFG